MELGYEPSIVARALSNWGDGLRGGVRGQSFRLLHVRTNQVEAVANKVGLTNIILDESGYGLRRLCSGAGFVDQMAK